MEHCRGLAWLLAGVVALSFAGCGDFERNGPPTAPSARPLTGNAGLTALLENTPFKGQDSGTFEFLQAGCLAGQSPLRTHTTGNATLIGKYSFETQECFDDNAFTFSGSFTITAANGDTLSGGYVGRVPGFIDNDTATYVFTATVDDGTGRFAGATGTLAGTGQANLATFEESRTFSGTIFRRLHS